MDKITPSQVTTWINHPITQEFLKSLKELRESNRLDVENIVLGNYRIKESMETLGQLKGQLLMLDTLKDLKDFMISEIMNRESLSVEKTYFNDGLENL